MFTVDRQEEFVLRTLEERDIRFVRLWFTDFSVPSTSVNQSRTNRMSRSSSVRSTNSSCLSTAITLDGPEYLTRRGGPGYTSESARPVFPRGYGADGRVSLTARNYPAGRTVEPWTVRTKERAPGAEGQSRTA